MPVWVQWIGLLEAVSLPVIGTVSLAASKLLVGPLALAAERWFLGILLAVTVITCRTVILSGECWLVHTATLAMMFVGALLLPDRRSLAERRVAGAPRMLY
ncbi:MAG: hypothetical protein EA381_09955 [Planctomycetaceae bacterium]|nr:MAG: hypothetical protein EA381_09955 [Planctomycetaceae bacterium]